MSLVPTSGVIAMIAKAQSIDPESTRLLCSMALFDVMTELSDIARPQFEADMDEFVEKRAAEVRRALVREFIDRRLHQTEVDDIVKAAAETTLLEVSKAAKDDPNTPYHDARDIMGRFTRAASAFRGSGYVDPIRNERYKALQSVGAGMKEFDNPKAKAVGGMVEAAGGLGPEAERVLGTSVKRVAYRYRGTERTANANVVGQVKNARALSDAMVAADAGDEQAAARLATLQAGFSRSSVKGQTFDGQRRVAPGQEPFMAVTRFWDKEGKKQGFTPDQMKMAVQGDIAAEYLRGKLPTPRQTAISMAAGRTPPSVGLMIDADGDVVSEAQGFNGDHFLPFDLKNLKRMQGGQYVRTRAAGGPTVEDVYTGLLTGARQVQVVSNSGVFTMEFDPTIRGGRRYSDKATQMIRRYEALVGTIGSGELMQQDISAERKKELRAEALKLGRASQEASTKIYNELLTEERTRQTFAMEDEEDLEARATEEARAELGPGAGRAQVADLAKERFNFLRGEQKAAQAKRFQLDADGYAAAMRSLQEEFPFYIRSVRTETIPEFVRSRGLVDPNSQDVPVGSRTRDGGHIERGEVNINATSEYGRKNNLGRGEYLKGPAAANTDVPDGETTTDGKPKEGAGAAPRTGNTPSQRVNDSSFRVKGVDHEKGTKALTELFDPNEPQIKADLNKNMASAIQAVRGSLLPDPFYFDGTAEAKDAVEGDPVQFAAWLGSKGGDKAAVLAAMPQDQRNKAYSLLADLPKAIENYNGGFSVAPFTPEMRKSIADAAKPLAALVSSAAPFAGPPGDLTADTDKPYAFPEIDALGDKTSNYDQYKVMAKRDPDLSDFLAMDEDGTKEQIKELKSVLYKLKQDPDFQFQSQQMQTLADSERRGGGLTKRLEAAHIAWAYHRGKKIAASAPASGGGAAPFVQGQIGFKPPDPVIKAFQGFRARQTVRKALFSQDDLLQALPAEGEWGAALREVLAEATT